MNKKTFPIVAILLIFIGFGLAYLLLDKEDSVETINNLHTESTYNEYENVNMSESITDEYVDESNFQSESEEYIPNEELSAIIGENDETRLEVLLKPLETLFTIGNFEGKTLYLYPNDEVSNALGNVFSNYEDDEYKSIWYRTLNFLCEISEDISSYEKGISLRVLNLENNEVLMEVQDGEVIADKLADLQ